MAAFLQNTAGVMNSVMEKLGALIGKQYGKWEAQQGCAKGRGVPRERARSAAWNAVLKKLTSVDELAY